MKRQFLSISMFILAISAMGVVISTAVLAAPPTNSNDHPTERAALMNLYASTYGEFWYENEGWGTNTPYCEWFGVTCDPSGHVQQLDLPGNSLEGPIPPQIDGLAALQRLDLSNNILITPLPEELGNLAQLQTLDLSDNLFCFKGCYRTLGGAIPPSLGDLSNLQTLDLSNNKLEGPIPPQLGNLVQLQILDLSGNYFCREEWGSGDWICSGGLYGTIPAALSSLSALQELYLQGNKSMCWETVAARNWALTLPLYAGPTDCSYLPLTSNLHFAKSAGSGSLTFVKSAEPRHGADFAFELSGPANPTTPTLLNKWGSEGSGDGQFTYPTGVAIDKAGNIYVTDTINNHIQKFDKDGTFITKWGSKGMAAGQFNEPRGVAVDSAGNLYVADQENHRIQKFDKTGAYLSQLGSEGSADGQFMAPKDVALDMADNLYVVDYYNNRIQKFDKDGNFLTKWGSLGSGDGQFYDPVDIAVGAAGAVYVVDSSKYNIQKFDQDGNFITKWGSQGSGKGQFDYPSAVASDAAGNIYVADHRTIWGNHRIQKFDKDGKFISQWGSEGSGDGQFSYPTGLALDRAGNVYVADSGNHRIQQFLASTFVLDDAGPDDGDAVRSSITYEKLPVGRYQVTELLSGDWDLEDLTCTGANSSQVTADLNHRALTIDLAADEHVTCTFTNHLQ